MYRIELAPGEETVFRTLEELVVGVRNGVVTARARIYHNASEKWLPIQFHPHYKKALALQSARVAEAPAARQAERPRLDTLSFAVAPAASMPTPELAAEPPAAQPAAEPAGTELAAAAQPSAPAVAAAEPSVTAEASVTQELSVTEASITPEPPVAPEPAPSHRPVSYLPASVRLVAEDPHVAIAPSMAREPLLLAPVTASPALELPKISYPEITPVEEPVAEPPTGSARGRRPLQLAAAMIVLAAGGYFAMSFLSPVKEAPAAPTAAVADRPALPQTASRAVPASTDATPSDATPSAPAALKPEPAPAPPPVVTPAAPASSGFAAALEPRAIVNGPAPKLPVNHGAAGAAAATPSPGDSIAPIAPVPDRVELKVPSLPRGESLVATPRTKGDSAMKQILRAVSGGKDAPKQP